jgi:Icc-related predicted phosphoesterase
MARTPAPRINRGETSDLATHKASSPRGVERFLQDNAEDAAVTMRAMAIYIVSDLHGAIDELASAVPQGAILVLLGDLINLLDHGSKTGILYEVFPVEAVEAVSKLRARGDYDEAKRVISERAAGRDDEIRIEIRGRIRRQYEEAFAALPDPTYLLFGNVDSPPLAREFAARTPGVTWADGHSADLEGEVFGFVGGALPTPFHAAGEVSEEDMRSQIEALGSVDVLCSHIPPAIRELCFDTVARKSERGSKDLLGYIRDVQPRRAYFGHVHQPLLSSLHVGKTLCINVGYFRATGRAWTHHREPAARSKREVVWQTR